MNGIKIEEFLTEDVKEEEFLTEDIKKEEFTTEEEDVKFEVVSTEDVEEEIKTKDDLMFDIDITDGILDFQDKKVYLEKTIITKDGGYEHHDKRNVKVSLSATVHPTFTSSANKMDDEPPKSDEPKPKRIRRGKEKTLDTSHINSLLEIPSGSEDEELSGSSEDEFHLDLDPTQKIDSDSDDTVPEKELVEITSDRSSRQWQWIKKDLPVIENEPSKLTPDIGDKETTPLSLFQLLFDDSLFHLLVKESNKYIMLKSYTQIKPITLKEMYEFIGMLLYMSIVHVPEKRMYWAPATKITQISKVMSINRFESILRVIHVSDNSLEKKRGEVGYDPFYKIRPIINKLNKNYSLFVRQETHQSVNEQIVPFKGHHSKKTKKSGYKIWVRAGISGYVNQFEMSTDTYDYKMNVITTLGESEEVVRRLTSALPAGTFVYFDNYFASSDLLAELKNKGLHATCTLQVSRSGKCPLLSEKDLKKLGRGSVDYRQDKNSEVVVCKWYDNRVVLAGSNIHSVFPLTIVRRYNMATKQYIDIPCPSLIQKYNKYKGGVDKADMFLSLYRIFSKSKKWYHRLIFHFIDLSVNNSWLLYRAIIESELDSHATTLLKYKIELAVALIGSEPKRDERIVEAVQGVPVPKDTRFDKYNHFPRQVGHRKNAKKCKFSGCLRKTLFKCGKCDLWLCVTGTSDCFFKFHNM